MAWFPRFRWRFLLWLWSAFALVAGCSLPFALVAWLGHDLPFWVIPLVSGLCVGLALVWRRPGGGGALLGALVSAGGIGAAWAGLNALDPDWHRLLHFGAIFCPAGAVSGGFVGVCGASRIGPIVGVGAVTGSMTGLAVSATYGCIGTVAEEFHLFALLVLPLLVLAGLAVGGVWGSTFGLLWCGCRLLLVPGARMKLDPEAQATHALLASRIMKRAFMFAGAWMAVLVLSFVACLVRQWVRLAPLRDLWAFGGHHRASGYVRLDNHVGDADLPRVVELLNELSNVRRWDSLNLSYTQVTGSGLAHLKGISKREYLLIVSDGQLDEPGLRNLGALGRNRLRLRVIGTVSDEEKESIQRALPNVAPIEFVEPPETARGAALPRPTPPGPIVVNNNSIGIELPRIGPGESWVGSPTSQPSRADAEELRCVSVAQPIWMGVYYGGGNWSEAGAACRTAARHASVPTERENSAGFRVVCDTKASQLNQDG